MQQHEAQWVETPTLCQLEPEAGQLADGEESQWRRPDRAVFLT